MIQTLESRQFFTVAVVGAIAPDADADVDGQTSSGKSSTVIIVSNDLGPTNRQKKHVSNISYSTPR